METLNVNMARLLTFAFMFSAFMSAALAQCQVEDLGCCLAEFTGFVSPRGISLSEERLSSVCTFVEETVTCMDTFLDQCLKNDTDVSEKRDIEELVNKTEKFMSRICKPTSDFMMKLKAKEECIQKSSLSFQKCYNKTVIPKPSTNDEKQALKNECCEYKELRNCAVQTVEDTCGPIASQLVQDDVMNLNGAVLEWACSGIFPDCPNSAVMLASSALLMLCYTILKFLL